MSFLPVQTFLLNIHVYKIILITKLSFKSQKHYYRSVCKDIKLTNKATSTNYLFY